MIKKALIPGFAGRYMVSEDGKVYDLKRNKVLKAHYNIRKTLSVKLSRPEGGQTTKTLTGLIGAAFVDNPKGYKFTKLKCASLGYHADNIVFVVNQDSPASMNA